MSLFSQREAWCAVIGDLHHALAAGAMTRSDVHAELGEIAELKLAREEERLHPDQPRSAAARTAG
jgi:hypothetical protein